MKCFILSLTISLAVFANSFAVSKEVLEMEKKRQCRSIHLGYQMKESNALYNEIVVQKSSSGTYFCALGFDRGYFGMQEKYDGKKVMIFSVWDNSQTNDKHSVDEKKRARILEKGKGVRTGRFGGEGTGAQSFFDYDWKIGEVVRFYVQAKDVEVDGLKFTDFTGWFYDNQRKVWQKMTTLRTPTAGIKLRSGYAFIEDFRRNYKSAKIVRRARFQNTWSLLPDGKWVPLTQARFTGDRNPAMNIDAGKEGDGFFLQTGGDTKMKTSKLWSVMQGNARKSKLPKSLQLLLK